MNEIWIANCDPFVIQITIVCFARLEPPIVRFGMGVEPGRAPDSGDSSKARTRASMRNHVMEEGFGDGILSATDVDMDISRVPDPKGDRVKVTMSGKFLSYKSH